ncbi:hypothetical protein ACFVVU_30640 [Kitasatospora sp. NPDC057965]|uniref:hypothetical protein n=1 Tax=Kitasatospora sp. NPDC057965 TaxID=3346291 RepID=UPI0036DA5104
MTEPPDTHAYAQRLRALADHLDAEQHKPSQSALRTLVGESGLLTLASEMAAAVHTDLGAWNEAVPASQFGTHLRVLRRRIASTQERITAALDDAALSLPETMSLLADHTTPAEAAAAAQAAEQRLWDGPEVRGTEQVYLLRPAGTAHTPQLGLVTTGLGFVNAYGTAKFTRAAAEQVVADMRFNNCFDAAFEPDGSLVYNWPPAYDDDAGRMRVVPDDRGLYEIGGQWPWDYRRPGNALPRAQAARITTHKAALPSGQPEPGIHPGTPARAEGRTR